MISRKYTREKTDVTHKLDGVTIVHTREQNIEGNTQTSLDEEDYREWNIIKVKNCTGFNIAILTLMHPYDKSRFRFIRYDRNDPDKVEFYGDGINTDNPSLLCQFTESIVKAPFKPTRKQRKQIKKALWRAYNDKEFLDQMGGGCWAFWLWYCIKHSFFAHKFWFWFITAILLLVFSANYVKNIQDPIWNYFCQVKQYVTNNY